MSFENEIGDEYPRSWRQEFSLKRTLAIMNSPGAINPCNHITPVWDGVSLKSVCFSAGSLTLYKGL
jgi:hypothetical protein